ncbi:MAG: ABC transporter substrate binding protein [Rhodothermales bacterium]
MKHHVTLGLLAALIFIAGCGTSEKQDVRRVGIVNGIPILSILEASFKARMTEHGYVEGQTIDYIARGAFDGREQEIQVVSDLMREDLDLLVSMPTEVSLIAREKTREMGIPLVFSNAFVEGTGLIESIRAPGKGITGVRFPGPDLVLLRLETLLKIRPDVRRVIVPYLDGYPIVAAQLDALRPAASRAGVALIEMPVPDGPAVQPALDALLASASPDVDAILLITDPISVDPDAIAALEAFATTCRIPFAGIFPDATPHTLFSLMIDLDQMGRLTADLAHRILQGEPAGSLPVLSADAVLGVNLQAAALLGITVPESVLSHADTIIH